MPIAGKPLSYYLELELGPRWRCNPELHHIDYYRARRLQKAFNEAPEGEGEAAAAHLLAEERAQICAAAKIVRDRNPGRATQYNRDYRLRKKLRDAQILSRMQREGNGVVEGHDGPREVPGASP